MRMRIPGRGGSGRSLARTLWRNLDSLPSSDQIERLMEREIARADRNGQNFSLALFRLRCEQDEVKGTAHDQEAVRRLALTLMRRSRLTDEVGWFNDEHLCALLPDTSAIGAQIFADSVCEHVSRKGTRPVAVIYSYPHDWVDEDENDEDGPAQPPEDPDPSGRGQRRTDGARTHATVQMAAAGIAGRIGFDAAGREPLKMAVGAGEFSAPDEMPGAPLMRREDLLPYLMQGAATATAVIDAPAKVEARPQQKTAAPETLEKPRVEPLVDLLAKPLPWWKRVIDVIGAILLLIPIGPILAISAAAIKLTSPGPVIFRQRRAGLGGKPFTIYKLRTMCVGAEKQQAALRKFNEQDGPAFKLTNDPRVTKVGKFLRKTSIDELPQLINVIKGEMSLVGPRPLPVGESDGCERWQKRRLDVTPGLTCIWQIKGRSEVTFAEWVRMDVTYMRRRTLFQDVAILLLTIPAVLLRRGAR